VVTNARLDDDWDDTLYDRAYYPKKVFKDGKGPRVPMMLTDGGIPSWVPRPRRAAVFDARNHQPHFADVTDASLRDARLAAHDAREAMIARLSDAWKVQPGGAGGEPLTTVPGAEPGGDDDDVESARDRYIAGLQNAYKTPMGQAPAASADDIERARQQWLSPGAKSGCGFGDARPGISRETATQDARDARDQAYAGYLDRLTNGWRK
jgi:hypothetical protein